MTTLRVARLLLPALALTLGIGASPAVAETPSPAPSPACTKPTANYFSFTPQRVASGDVVQVSGSLEDLCRDSQPSQAVRVYAQRADDASPVVVATTSTDNHGHFTVDIVVNVTETLSVEAEGRGAVTYVDWSTGARQTSPVVRVDRVSGSCASALTLTAPSTVATGGLVRVHGTAPDTATVSILFRKRGQTAFQVRRTLTPAADRTFSTTFVGDDDYRVYASGQRCDSQPALVQAQPVISGPATVRRGSSVTLLVRAPAGVPVKVYFHRAGSNGYQARRSGTVDSSGRYVTSYVADADYRYYAVTGPGLRTSNLGLTQTRG